jgi:DNA-binding MarR family transcriptional regulator
MDRSHEEVGELNILLCRINSLLNIHTRNFLADKGLTMPRFWALSDLHHNGELTMGDLQRITRTSSATLTGLVDGLVEGGLVKRWRADQDRRLVYLAITPDGQKIVQDVIRLRIAILQDSLSGQQIELERLNGELRSILDKIRLTAEDNNDKGRNR